MEVPTRPPDGRCPGALFQNRPGFLVAKKRELIYLFPRAALAQLVEHLICNQAVSGSSPLGGSISSTAVQVYRPSCRHLLSGAHRRVFFVHLFPRLPLAAETEIDLLWHGLNAHSMGARPCAVLVGIFLSQPTREVSFSALLHNPPEQFSQPL